MEDFNTSLSSIDRFVRQKLREIRELKNVETQISLPDIYNTFQLNTHTHTHTHTHNEVFFSTPHGTLSKIENIIVLQEISIDTKFETKTTQISEFL